MKKKSRAKGSKMERGGIPRILAVINSESLTEPLTLKLWPSLAKYINEGPGVQFIRECVIEKLERLSDAPNPAVCGECNFLRRESPFFCPKINAFIDEGALNEPWDCKEFSQRREVEKIV